MYSSLLKCILFKKDVYPTVRMYFPCQDVFFPISIYASLPPLVGKSGWTINLLLKGGDHDLSHEMCFLTECIFTEPKSTRAY